MLSSFLFGSTQSAKSGKACTQVLTLEPVVVDRQILASKWLIDKYDDNCPRRENRWALQLQGQRVYSNPDLTMGRILPTRYVVGASKKC